MDRLILLAIWYNSSFWIKGITTTINPQKTHRSSIATNCTTNNGSKLFKLFNREIGKNLKQG